MQASTVSWVFAALVLASLAARLWLATRQMRHVAAHRDRVPEPFAGSVGLDVHRKAADYTLAKGRLGLVGTAVGTAVLLGWTLLGGLDALNAALLDSVRPRLGDMAYQLALLAAFVLIGTLIELPLEWFSVFRVEQRHGFNRTTPALFATDQVKGLVVAAVLGLPLAALVLGLMGSAGAHWWLWAWAAWVGFMLLMMVVFPTVIAPWFNRFEPLADAELAARVRALMTRCGFAARGLYVMDGSRRSAHGNAYFTGLGRAKRVVFFDTLLQRLAPSEVEAVLAHELGHYRLRHVPQRLAMMVGVSGVALATLGWLAQQPAFYLGLGVQPSVAAPNDALALILFMLALPPLAFFATPLGALLSRRHEFQADAYACAQADGAALASALLRLHEDNASTLTPDPLYARFYYSHPPAVERLAALPAPAVAAGTLGCIPDPVAT